jgi:phage shock protein C
MNNTKKIYRSEKNRILFGVCGGLAEYFEVDPLLVRILFILLSLGGGSGIILYIILAVLMPKESDKTEITKDNIIEESKKRTKQLANEVKGNGNWIKDVRNIMGIFLVLVGVNMLSSNLFQFDIFAWVGWSVVWALIIIFIGVRIIKK